MGVVYCQTSPQFSSRGSEYKASLFYPWIFLYKPAVYD